MITLCPSISSGPLTVRFACLDKSLPPSSDRHWRFLGTTEPGARSPGGTKKATPTLSRAIRPVCPYAKVSPPSLPCLKRPGAGRLRREGRQRRQGRKRRYGSTRGRWSSRAARFCRSSREGWKRRRFTASAISRGALKLRRRSRELGHVWRRRSFGERDLRRTSRKYCGDPESLGRQWRQL
jgi:hypothetical protein